VTPRPARASPDHRAPVHPLRRSRQVGMGLGMSMVPASFGLWFFLIPRPRLFKPFFGLLFVAGWRMGPTKKPGPARRCWSARWPLRRTPLPQRTAPCGASRPGGPRRPLPPTFLLANLAKTSAARIGGGGVGNFGRTRTLEGLGGDGGRGVTTSLGEYSTVEISGEVKAVGEGARNKEDGCTAALDCRGVGPWGTRGGESRFIDVLCFSVQEALIRGWVGSCFAVAVAKQPKLSSPQSSKKAAG